MGSLVITDEPILKRGVKVYDPAKHGLNRLPMAYREAREFAAAVFPDKDLMTYRNGRRALSRLVMGTDRLHAPILVCARSPDGNGREEPAATIRSLDELSPTAAQSTICRGADGLALGRR